MSLYVVEWERSRLLTLGPAMVLVDCGEGTADAWTRSGLRPWGPDAVLFTGPKAAQIAGLYGLLDAMSAADRSEPIRLLHGLDNEGVGNLVGAFLQSEQCPYPVALEADRPGAVLMVGGLRCASKATHQGLRWSISGEGREVSFG